MGTNRSPGFLFAVVVALASCPALAQHAPAAISPYTLSMSVTISGGKIASISASEDGGETNCYHNACNTLKPEALQAQSANIASVSGATYSSEAFKTTLQAILNSAKA